MTCRNFLPSIVERSCRLRELSPFDVFEKIDRKSTRIVTLCQHTSMTVRDIAAAVGGGKSSVSRITNQQKNFESKTKEKKHLEPGNISPEDWIQRLSCVLNNICGGPSETDAYFTSGGTCSLVSVEGMNSKQCISIIEIQKREFESIKPLKPSQCHLGVNLRKSVFVVDVYLMKGMMLPNLKPVGPIVQKWEYLSITPFKPSQCPLRVDFPKTPEKTWMSKDFAAWEYSK
ncbi:hypothetical protein TNCV_1198971 [Trichonephila clavipes]|uniref:Uncharacterized protein n=1 Tax=Trichonephila clavipes TaxID=2585209 RepID=A0A8X6VE55_TRICX|nr:hypothetical protein TNCV_1198971 [Trichonephila clavipes]